MTTGPETWEEKPSNRETHAEEVGGIRNAAFNRGSFSTC